MHLYFVLTVIFGGKCLLAAGGVTHMPVEAEPTRPPFLQDMINEEFVSEGCRHSINNQTYETFTDQFKKHEIRESDVRVTPCEKCYFRNLESLYVPEGGARTHAYNGDAGVMVHMLSVFKQLNIECKACHMVDDSGNKVAGDLTAIWTNGGLEAVFLIPDTGLALITVPMINATNVNQEAVKVECIGDEAYKSLCKTTHEKGELDHMFQNSAENLLTVNEESVLAKAYGNVRKGLKALEDMFFCLPPEEDDFYYKDK